ncbi:MAG: ABC transporter substrate-binding protein [Candidatus Hydrothermarchaeales archaeon]
MSGDLVKRREFLKTIGIAGVTLAGFSITGCLGPKEAAPAQKGYPETVKIGYHPAMCLAGIYIAKDHDMFKRAGIDAKIIEYQAGPPMIPAFQGGEIDIGFLGGPPAISAMDKGVDVSIIGAAHTEGSAIIVRRDSSFKKVEDLEDTIIAVPMYGSIQDVLTRMVLKEHGLDSSDVRLMEAGELGGVSQLPTLLRRGDIDAYVAWPPFNEIPLVEGHGRALLKPSEMIPYNPCCVIAARNDFTAEHPGLTKEILRITDDASTFTMAYPKEAARSINNVVGYDVNVAEYSLNFAGWYCALPTEESIQTTMNILRNMKELGYIKRDLTRDRVYNLEYIYEVHTESVHKPGEVGARPEIYERVTGIKSA